MNVSLVWITPDAERIIASCARVSSPANQDNHETAPRLIRYMVKHRHWSPFEMACACIEIETTRDIGRQLLRHRSFSFQEFSQRYADTQTTQERGARYSAASNRQSSSDPLTGDDDYFWACAVSEIEELADDRYQEAVTRGIARECARALLPEGLTKTRLYMQGTIRSWLHFIDVRDHEDAQLECQEIARACREVLRPHLPAIFGATA